MAIGIVSGRKAASKGFVSENTKPWQSEDPVLRKADGLSPYPPTSVQTGLIPQCLKQRLSGISVVGDAQLHDHVVG